jgi:hypothetical protein
MGIVRRNRFPDGVGNLPTISQAISGQESLPPAPSRRAILDRNFDQFPKMNDF